MRIAINAQIVPGHGTGGVESFVMKLVYGLGQLNDGTEEYIIIGDWQAPDWLTPHLGPNQRIACRPKSLESSLARRLGPLLPVAVKGRHLARQLLGVTQTASNHQVPVSDGFYESLGCDVIHFPYQAFAICSLPSIYNPHDLQHLHYPQFFTPPQIAWREVIYPAGCHFAHTIVAGSEWVKQDIINHYRVNPDKVQVIPGSPLMQTDIEPGHADVALKYQLQLPFALYPAVTWEHKNHIRLLEAIALLRNHGVRVNLVCTGYQTDFWRPIEERLVALDLQEQVRFLGLVPWQDLQALYQLARFVVIPSLFEAASGPIFEAWQEGTPVACSTVTSLPDQVGDAALLFNPLSVGSIAGAMAKMATDDSFLESLQRRGQVRLQDFSNERTAKAYRAVYRRAAGIPLSEEEEHLLAWDWMRERQREVVV